MQFYLQFVSQRWKRGMLQVAGDMIQVATSNGFRKSLQEVEPSSTPSVTWCSTNLLCAIIASPKTLRNKFQRGHVTRCNLPATCQTKQTKFEGIPLREGIHF